MGGIGAIILAAGSSSRLGRPKQLLKIDGETLLDRAISAASTTNCDPIIVVTGAIAGAHLFDGSGAANVAVVSNPNWAKGIGSSIDAGIIALEKSPSAPEATIIMTCDQPHASADVIGALIATFRRTKKPIVASRYAETVGVPALFARECWSELQALPPDAGAKRVIERNPARLATVEFALGAVDIDSPADLVALPKTSLPRRV